MVDGGYTGDSFASEVKKLTGAVVEVAKRNELHKFEVIPKRWVVERGLTNITDFGKTASVKFIIRFN